MKNKNVAALLALFLGGLGVHRFYLGQIGMGFLSIFIPFLGFIDFIRFMMMSQEEFDFKYNREYLDVDYGRVDNRRYQNRREPNYGRQYDEAGYEERNRRSDYGDRRQQRERHRRRREDIRHQEEAKRNPYKVSGQQRLKNYEYEEAVRDFRKSLSLEPNDSKTHFLLASAYSLLELKDEGFFHLRAAIKNGFSNFSEIENHQDLAFLRTQPEYEVLEDEFYGRNRKTTRKTEQPSSTAEPDLLEQIKMLGDLRKRGLLTEEEFVAQKKKLLR